MSYDLRFAVKVKDAPKDMFAIIGQPELHSPTYNIGMIFRKAMDFDFVQGEFYKLSELIPHIERGMKELRINAKEYKHLEPENGWGTTDSALKALKSIMDWIDDDLKWGWNSDIPLDCIYMAW